MQKIEILSGQLTLVPIANPTAFPNHRYVTHNLNNIFRYHANALTGGEQDHANHLTKLIPSCDYLLDLHSFPSSGIPFAFEDFSDKKTAHFVEGLGIKNIIVDWFSLNREENRAEPAQYAQQHRKISAVVECGRNDDPEAANTAYEVITNALGHLGLIKKQPRVLEEFRKYKVSDLIMRPPHMSFDRSWKNFEELQKGTVIARHKNNDQVLVAPYDAAILMPYDQADVGTEWYFLAQVERGKPLKRVPSPQRDV